MLRYIIITKLVLLLFVGNALSQKNTLENTLIFRVADSGAKSTSASDNVRDFLKKEYAVEADGMFSSNKSSKGSGILGDIYTVKLDSEEDYYRCMMELGSMSDVVYVQPYYLPHLLSQPDDELAGSQYALEITKAFEAFGISTGDTNIVIGIVDTGVDSDHEDLADNIKINYADPVNGIDDDLDGYVDNFRGWDVAMNDPNPECTETQPHGVLVSGIASAVTNNGVGIAGSGYNCKFLPIKVSDASDRLTAVYQGVVYAADHGCKIINCSWGDTIPNPALQDIIDYAVKTRGCIVVAAAGNAGNDLPYYPASYDGVLSVGATNWSDVKWVNSTFGCELDICAPGVGILTTKNKGGYSSSWVNGTSYAAPLVAGAAALLWAKEPDLTNEQVVERLRISADIVDTIYENTYYKRKMGYGRLNIESALLNDTTPSVRVVDKDITTSGSSRFVAGDTIDIVITLKNHLVSANSCLVELLGNSQYITVIDDFFNAGSIQTFETKNNRAYPFRIVLNNNVPYDHKAKLSFEMTVNGKPDYYEMELILNPSYVNVEGNNIKTTYTSNGHIGYSNPGRRIGYGFIHNNIYNLLGTGGVVMGVSKYEIVSSIDNSEFLIDEVVDTTHSGSVVSGISSYFPDNNKWESGIVVNQESRVFVDNTNESSAFHSYKVLNTSGGNVEGLYFGLFADWDIWYKYANRAEYDSDLKMVYVYSTSTNIMYAGIVLLSGYNAIPYCFDIGSGGNGGIDISSDFSDEKKMLALSNVREYTASTSIDVATMLSAGPFEIKPDESVKLDYLLLAADNLLELKEKALAAKIAYEVIGVNENRVGDAIYPNPANDVLNVILPDGGGRVFARVYSSTGLLVESIDTKGSFTVGLNSYTPGTYLIHIIKDTEVITERFVVDP